MGLIINISDSLEDMAQAGGSFIIAQLLNDTTLALGGATGNTQITMLELLAQGKIKGHDQIDLL